MSIISEHNEEFEKAIEHFKSEISVLRTGRATPAMVENICVEVYGSKMEIKGVASISTPDAKTIIVDPWDKNNLKEIEKAIREANIGMSPVIDQTIIRLNMPPMTEENRKDMVKVLKQKMEQARTSVRLAREKVRDRILKAEEAGEIREDDRFRLQEELDEKVGELNREIEKITQEKEKEIMTV
ncbi:ribosome recycling factor [Patescibacteria group bacterium]|nr:ribosome recycling factor [Patescibacteria group bacterium]MBU1922443.1 ribosome recycling factor [Patescibacteria group bacterium]